ncbi:tail fiber assembly protein-like protein [Escherichia coli TA008]|nr:tail fiber assembly protein-like protein [Escherichia coli TA008]
MMNKAVLNSELIAIKAGDITVYNYDGETREYISTSTEYLAVGVGGNDSNLLIVFYVQIMPDDFVMQLHRF